MVNRRSGTALYSASDPNSHQVRLMLEEKKISCDALDIELNAKYKQELLDLNPYHSAPTLLDRELVLYPVQNILEYLEERYPHPPLMPAYPVARAKTRLMLYRVETDWYQPMWQILEQSSDAVVESARKVLLRSLMSVMPMLAESPFFMSEEFSLIDCRVAPLLWRLPKLGIQLPKTAKPLIDYAERLFQREAFQMSLTPTEKAMRM